MVGCWMRLSNMRSPHQFFCQVPHKGFPIVRLECHRTTISRYPVRYQMITSLFRWGRLTWYRFCQFREVVYTYQYLIVSRVRHADLLMVYLHDRVKFRAFRRFMWELSVPFLFLVNYSRDRNHRCIRAQHVHSLFCGHPNTGASNNSVFILWNDSSAALFHVNFLPLHLMSCCIYFVCVALDELPVVVCET